MERSSSYTSGFSQQGSGQSTWPRPWNAGSSPAPELTGFSLKGYPAVAETPRAAHLSAQVGAFLFKDQGQVLFIVSCKEPINLLQPVRDDVGSHSLQLVTMKQNSG